MNHIILADNQAIFRAGAARVLSQQDDMRIVAQCDDLPRLVAAIDAVRGAVVVVASSLNPRLPELAIQVRAMDGRLVLVVENREQISEEACGLLDGLVARAITGQELTETIRRVGRGERVSHGGRRAAAPARDSVAARVRERLTRREMQIVSLIVQGCKNKDIAAQLGTKEQVVKNYLRSIYDKTGVSDRLELALFTIHHRILTEPAAATTPLTVVSAAASSYAT
ncbi:MAG: response regulator transcription factor [Acidobacteriota bacterium]|nr:response regulator transcription factor [Acidobacteriota bacterium]